MAKTNEKVRLNPVFSSENSYKEVERIENLKRYIVSIFKKEKLKIKSHTVNVTYKGSNFYERNLSDDRVWIVTEKFYDGFGRLDKITMGIMSYPMDKKTHKKLVQILIDYNLSHHYSGGVDESDVFIFANSEIDYVKEESD